MARKSKAKKSKSRTSKVGTVTPTLLEDGTGFTIRLHDVVRALKVIEKHKQLDKFVRAAKKADAFVRMGAKSVNFVKNFLADNKMHTDPVGKHIVNARVETDRPVVTMSNATEAVARTVGAGAPARDPFRPCRFSSRG